MLLVEHQSPMPCSLSGPVWLHAYAVLGDAANDGNLDERQSFASGDISLRTKRLENGRTVPEVDELASVVLDLWAAEHGYTKLQPNLFGI